MDKNDIVEKNVDAENVPPYDDGKHSGLEARRRSSVVNAEVLAGELFDTRYESTQRGLKSRWAACDESVSFSPLTEPF
jgi:hypothetical protein